MLSANNPAWIQPAILTVAEKAKVQEVPSIEVYPEKLLPLRTKRSQECCGRK